MAADLALLAEGIVVVPLYARQRPSELAGILRDSNPSLLLYDSPELPATLLAADAPEIPSRSLGEILEGDAPTEPAGAAARLANEDPITIIYTSGTSGEPKGVVLNARNLEHMVGATLERLDLLMRGHGGEERAFHYLPFCFAGSWILLLLALTRRTTLTLNTDLNRIVDDLALAQPHFFQNVPVLMDRVRDGVEKAIHRRGGPVRAIWQGAFRCTVAAANGEKPSLKDRLALKTARATLIPSIRARIGAHLKSLICGSAPLSRDTQLFFEMIGIPVLQVYGLTETTAICTMDSPGQVVPGRVGHAVPDVEMKLGENQEILVRGPNVFAGYWNKPEATVAAFQDGWFRTGDQGEMDEAGNWRILGRVKNLIVPSSGHNVAPEPLEEKLSSLVPGAQQVVLIGSGRPHLSAIVTGPVDPAELERALEAMNSELPHYKKIRGSIVVAEPFTIESGLVTANGKVRRDAVAERLADRIDALYAREGIPA
ncbi:MAG: long-chain-fatty-acid--CoA ligase [Gemmatimonadota bacterium]|nr:MAG: long-chain-fatty-acid--CoA ligase [Gemmatimonadota bacterium]